jgi:hypothetical protein
MTTCCISCLDALWCFASMLFLYIFLQFKRYLNVQVYCRTLAYIYRCLLCSVHRRYYQFAIDVLIDIYYINLKLILENIWKMIDQIIFPWKIHSGDWKSTPNIGVNFDAAFLRLRHSTTMLEFSWHSSYL